VGSIKVCFHEWFIDCNILSRDWSRKPIMEHYANLLLFVLWTARELYYIHTNMDIILDIHATHHIHPWIFVKQGCPWIDLYGFYGFYGWQCLVIHAFIDIHGNPEIPMAMSNYHRVTLDWLNLRLVSRGNIIIRAHALCFNERFLVIYQIKVMRGRVWHLLCCANALPKNCEATLKPEF